jgi:hypothetical protein
MVEQVVGLDLQRTPVAAEIVVAVVELDIMVAEAVEDIMTSLLLEVEVVVDRDLFLPVGPALFLNKVDWDQLVL